MFYSNTKIVELQNNWADITICLAKLLPLKKATNKRKLFCFVSVQRQAFYMKTDVRSIVAGDINLPQKHCCATLSIFIGNSDM